MSRLQAFMATRNGLLAALAPLLLVGIMGTTATFPAQAQSAPDSGISYAYDKSGNRTQVTGPLGRVTNFSYDALHRLRQQDQPIVNVARPQILFGYDGIDQLQTVTDPRKLVTTYTRDGLGNEQALASPDTGTASQSHDEAGNLTSRTDARSKKHVYSYDALNRLTRITYPTGTPTVLEYDGGATSVKSAIGKLSGFTDESGRTAYTFDAFGRLLTQTSTVGSVAIKTYKFAIEYSTSNQQTGQRVSTTYPSGNRLVYTYDANGLVTSISLLPAKPDGTTSTTTVALLRDIQYAPFGAPTGWTWGNSTTTAPNTYSRTFDLDGRVATYTLGPQGPSRLVRTLIYDAASRITAMKHTGTDTSAALPASFDQAFEYDNLDRLNKFISATQTQQYTYDATGNRTSISFSGQPYAVNVAATSNRLTSAAGHLPNKTYSIDAAGNVTGDGTRTYTYSDRGRRSATVAGNGSVAYLYNALEQRVRKAGAGSLALIGTIDYVYDDAEHLIGEYDANGLVQETVYLDDMPVAVLKRNAAGQMQVHYIFADHLNAPKTIVRASDNKIVWQWVGNDPFGAIQPLEDPTGVGAFVYNLRFPGQVYEKESGLYYNYFRDYDPQTGRYVQSDPIGLDGGINTYGYVGGDPVSYYDAPGLNRTRAPTNGPTFYSAQVALITSQIRAINPSFTYQTVRPSNGPGSGYNQNDVSALSRILRDYQRNSQTNRDGVPVGRFVCDARGNMLIEPRGGRTRDQPEFSGHPDTHTLYPNGSNYMRNNPVGHGPNTTPHGHAHLVGPGTGRAGQGPPIDIFGNVVPPNSPAAHYPTY